MQDTLKPRNRLREISSLFITQARELAGRGALASSGGEPAQATGTLAAPMHVALIFQHRFEGSFLFSLSLCRWLLGADSRVTLIAPSPAQREWGRFAPRYGLPARLDPPGPDEARSFRLQANLDVALVDRPLALEDPGGESGDAEADEPRPEGSGRILVHAFDTAHGDAARHALSWCDAAVMVLEPALPEFLRAYRGLRAAGPEAADCELYTILDCAAGDVDSTAIERIWGEIGARFLGSPLRLLGQFCRSDLADDGRALAARLRTCEERLRPWPEGSRLATMTPRARDAPARRRAEAFAREVDLQSGPGPQPAAANGRSPRTRPR